MYAIYAMYARASCPTGARGYAVFPHITRDGKCNAVCRKQGDRGGQNISPQGTIIIVVLVLQCMTAIYGTLSRILL